MSKSDINLVKVALVGNIANNFFRLADALQAVETLQVHLFMRKEDNTPNTELPESDKPELKNNYPHWIYFLPSIDKLSSLMLFFNIPLFGKRIKRLLEYLNKYDICVFSGPETILIPFVKTKTIFRATGSDLTVYPNLSYSDICVLRPRREFALTSHVARPINFLIWNIRRQLSRKAIRMSDYIDASIGYPNLSALNKLAVPNSKRLHIIRLNVDQTVFCKNPEAANLCKSLWKIGTDAFIVLLPSRIMMSNHRLNKVTGQWKASDVAIRGFKLFIDKLSPERRSNAFLIIPDRTYSDELPAAKSLIKNIGLENNVIYIRGESPHGLTRHELILLYSRANAVMNDFGCGWYGSIVVEALSCECPVITYISEEQMKLVAPWHPLLIAKGPKEICLCLMKLFYDNHYREKVGLSGRDWVRRFHSNEYVCGSMVTSLINTCFINRASERLLQPQ